MYGDDPSAAVFYFAEATKARTLLEDMAQAAGQSSGVELREDIRQREKSLHQRLAAAEVQREKALLGGPEARQEAQTRWEELNAERHLLVQEISGSHHLYAALHYPQPLPAKDLPLQNNEVLLEYVLGEEAGYLLVVRQGGVQQLFPLNLGRAALEEEVRELLEPLHCGRLVSFSLAQGKKLHDLLLAPALGMIKEGDRLIVVPDGNLGVLPFEALVMQPGDSYRTSVFVGDRYSLTYYQSATVLALQRRLPEPKTRRPLFALGNPIFQPQDPRYVNYLQGNAARQFSAADLAQYIYKALATTPGDGKTNREVGKGKELHYEPMSETETEVKEIAKLFGIESEPPNILLGVKANETQLRQAPLQEYKYLHFATHADLPGKVQGIKEPFILLGQVENKDGDNGLLTLSEVLDLKLRARMVVLSACVTGRGDYLAGEGVFNFARAFQHAGARSVVVSLWPVKDYVAVEFMKTLYGHLKQGRERATALRLTRQKIKEDYPDPFLWAVFILHGEG